MKRFRRFFWFFGVWTIPIGTLLAFLYSLIILNIKKMLNYISLSSKRISLEKWDYLIMLGIIIGLMVIVTLNNCRKKFIIGEKEFNPLSNLSPTRISEDKRKAQRHPPPREYLSKVPNGYTLGRRFGKYVRIPFLSSPEHQLIIGAPGSNKSTVTLNAIIWNFNFEEKAKRFRSLLAIDCKEELSRLTVNIRNKYVKIINPSKKNTTGFDVYYGLTQESTDDEVKERCDTIARTLIVNVGGHNSFFYVAAQKILCALLMYGFRKNISFIDMILRILSVPCEDLIAEIIADQEMKKHPKITGLVKVFDGKDSDAFQDVTMTLQQDLSIFDTDTIKACLSPNNPDIVTPNDLVKGNSIFLAIPDHLLQMYSPVFRMIIQLCLKHIVSIPEYQDTDNRPIWFLIDEAGSIGPIPDLINEGLPRARSKHVQVSLICQSFGQLEETYGQTGARSILDCCKTTIVFSCNDTRTSEILSKWTGMYRETKISSQQRGTIMSDISSQNISSEFRPVMDISDIKNLEKNDEVLVFVKGSWFLVEKAPYYKIKLLKEKSAQIAEINNKVYRGE